MVYQKTTVDHTPFRNFLRNVAHSTHTIMKQGGAAHVATVQPSPIQRAIPVARGIGVAFRNLFGVNQ